MSRRRQRRDTVSRNFPAPQRGGLEALSDLYRYHGLKAAGCILWMLDKLDRRERPGTRAMARECKIRPETAKKILTGDWKAWALSVPSGNTSNKAKTQAPPELQDKLSKLRETLGNTSKALQSPAAIGVPGHE